MTNQDLLQLDQFTVSGAVKEVWYESHYLSAAQDYGVF